MNTDVPNPDPDQNGDASSSAFPPPPAAEDPSDFTPLDPRIIKLWRVQHLIGTGVLLVLLLVLTVVIGLAASETVKWAVAFWLVVALLRLWLLYWYPPRAYRAWGYRLDGKVLETRHGVWFREIQLLPLSRLQHVDLQSGPIERSFGLASLDLHTAGTHNDTISIPGLEAAAAARLRDHLVAAGGDDGV